MNNKILITGGCGFLGRHLVNELKKTKNEVHILDINNKNVIKYDNYYQVDLLNKEELNKIVARISPDIIYHLAAINSRTRDFVQAENIYNVNLNGTLNLLNSLKKNKYKNFIYVNTSEIYNEVISKSPFKEESLFLPASPYSLSKYFGELTIRTFSKINLKNFTILRFFNLFGDNISNDFFLPQLISALKRNVDFDMTKGEQIRDFLYIDDAIKALLIVGDENATNDVFNVCSGKGISLRDLALFMKKLFHSKSNINFGKIPYRNNEVWNMVGDNSKFVSIFGFSPREILSVFIEKYGYENKN